MLVVWMGIGASFATAFVVLDLLSIQTASPFVTYEGYISMFEYNRTVPIRDLYRYEIPITRITQFATYSMARHVLNLIMTSLGWTCFLSLIVDISL